MSKKVKRHPSEYLNNLEEWQNHQYNPGHYLGGNISPQLEYGSGTKGGKYLGVIFLIIAFINGIPAVFSFIYGSSNLVGLFISILFIIAGLKLIISINKNGGK